MTSIKYFTQLLPILHKRSSPDHQEQENEFLNRSTIRRPISKKLTIQIPEITFEPITVVQCKTNFIDYQKSSSHYALSTKKGNFRHTNEDRVILLLSVSIR